MKVQGELMSGKIVQGNNEFALDLYSQLMRCYRELGEVFRTVADGCDSVSSTFQLGFSLEAGRDFISTIIDSRDPPEEPEWRDVMAML